MRALLPLYIIGLPSLGAVLPEQSGGVAQSLAGRDRERVPGLGADAGDDQDRGKTMVYRREWKFVLGLAVGFALLSLALVRAEAQVPAASGKAKVDRLVLGLIEKYRDYWHCRPHDPA